MALPVYLIHWNAPDWCVAAVESVLASEDVVVEVTVVDNGHDAALPLRDRLPTTVKIIDSGANRGYTGGANLALRDWLARDDSPEFCIIGSHDLQVDTDTLARLVSTANQRDDAGVVAPVLVGAHPATGGRWTGTRSYQEGLSADLPELIERDWASGTCLLLRRACVDDVGDFDERLGSYMEDVDYGLRANDRGWAVLVDSKAQAHGIGSASGSSIASITTNTVLLAAKRDGWLGASRALLLFSAWAARGTVTSVWPLRSRAQRTVSKRYAQQRRAGLRQLGWRSMTAMVRDRATAAPSGRAGHLTG